MITSWQLKGYTNVNARTSGCRNKHRKTKAFNSANHIRKTPVVKYQTKKVTPKNDTVSNKDRCAQKSPVQ